MNTDRTDEMLKQGGWTSWYMLRVFSRSGSTDGTCRSIGHLTPTSKGILYPLPCSSGVDSGTL